MARQALCGNWRAIASFLLAVFILEHILVAIRVSHMKQAPPVLAKFDAPSLKIDSLPAVTVCSNCTTTTTPPVSNDPLVVYYKNKPPDPQANQDSYYTKRANKVNEFTYDFLLKPNNPCDDDTFLAVLVHSKTSYNEMRDVIRQTWGSSLVSSLWPVVGSDKLPKIKLVFMLGADPQPVWNSYVQLENRVHNDLVQGSFMDSYINMTLKSLLGLRWVWQECPQVRYMLKIDDDMVVNFPRLVSLLRTTAFTRAILGPLNPASPVERGGLWGVPEDVFPFPTWPMYASGAAYVISQDIVKELYEAAEYIPHIHVDDAYITGVLAKVINAGHRTDGGFAYWGSPKPHPCDFVKNRIYTGTKIQTREDKLWFWQELANPKIQC